MNAEAYLSAQIEREIASAKALVEKAEAEGRHLTDDERGKIEEHKEKADKASTELDEVKATRELRESIEKLGTNFAVTDRKTVGVLDRQAMTPGQAFVKSPEFQALLKSTKLGSESPWSVQIASDMGFGGKANETVESDGVPGAFVRPGVIEQDKQPNTLMSILPSITIGSQQFRYIAETTATNSAASVAELGASAQSVLVHDDTTVAVKRLSTHLIVSDEFLSDVGFASYVDSRLGAFVEYEEEDQVINGAGAGADLNGFLDRVTQAQALGADTIADAIYKAKTKVRTGSFLEPTHMLVNPTDWEKLRLLKDANDSYLMGMGPWAGPGGSEPPVWGLTPIVTTRISAGTAMVGAFSNPIAAQVVRNQGVTVEATNSHGTLFIAGQVVVRATSRLALAVYRPGAFCEVTGL